MTEVGTRHGTAAGSPGSRLPAAVDERGDVARDRRRAGLAGRRGWLVRLVADVLGPPAVTLGLAEPRVWPRGWLLRRGLLAADIVALMFTFALTELLFGHLTERNRGFGEEFGLFLLTLPLWVVIAKLYGLYDRDETRRDYRTVDDFASVFHLATVGTWAVFAGSRLAGIATPDLTRVSVFWAVAIGAITAARSGARMICRRHQSYVQRTFIVGSGRDSRMIAMKLQQNPHYGLRFVGFVDRVAGAPVPGIPDERVVGTIEDLPSLVRTHDIDRVIVSSEADDSVLLEKIRELSAGGVQVDVLPRFHHLLGPDVDVHMVAGVPLWSLRPFRLSRSALLLKRSLDLLLSALGLVLLAPAFVVIAVLVKLDSPGPVFFRQMRIRDGQREFRMWKFRTMVSAAEEQKPSISHLNIHKQGDGDGRMFKVANDPRTTRVGRVLRRFSLDELPQLLNVLTGEMSLVGPRPLIPEEHQYVTEWRRRRLDLKPGMTGLWQVSGRSQIPFEEMVMLDYLYVTNWSLGFDGGLLLKTLQLVARGGSAPQ